MSELEKKKREKKPKSKLRKTLEWVFTGLFLAVFGFFSVMMIVGFASRKDNHNVPNYGGIQVLEVLTDSMEPAYKTKSVVFVKKVKMDSFKEGDDITFMYYISSLRKTMPMTHRLMSIKTPEETGRPRSTSSQCMQVSASERLTKARENSPPDR